MTKQKFKSECQRLESLGYLIVEYEPEAKFAKYELNGSVKIIGVRK